MTTHIIVSILKYKYSYKCMYPCFINVCVIDDKTNRILVQITTYSNMNDSILVQIIFFQTFPMIYKMQALLKKFSKAFIL